MIEGLLDCSAYTAIDNPEEEKDRADRVNFHAVKIYIDIVYHKRRAGEGYNIGSGNENNYYYIAQAISEFLDELLPKESGSYLSQISYVEDRASHARRYAIDAYKIKMEWDGGPMRI